jgi:hypothetical protein
MLLAFALACAAPPAGLRATPAGDGPLVRVDWDALPLPDIPFPNDLATRPDPTSPTGLRPNLPEQADVEVETLSRQRINRLAGFGIFAPISVAFEGDLDVDEVLRRHPGDPLDPGSFRDDAILLIDVDPDSPDFGKPVPLDFGHGRFPQDATRLGTFLANDPRADQPSLLFDTGNEDLDGDGVLDPGEDTDGDGLLDLPNVWPPGGDPRLDLLTWYDLQTDALQLRPVVPLREETTYAVVLTSALVDGDGEPVRSPWAWVNHTRQTAALEPVIPALEALDRDVDDVAFAWVFTTGQVTRDLWDLAEGVRGRGIFAGLATEYPAGVIEGHHLRTTLENPLLLPVDALLAPLSEIGILPDTSLGYLEDAYPAYTAGIVGGAFVAADLLVDRDDGGRDDSDETWEIDRAAGTVVSGPRRIVFTCAIPRETEENKPPWPVVIHMHGYGSTRVEQVAFDYALNRAGMAVCGIDAAGHGISLPDDYEAQVSGLLDAGGLAPLYYHLTDDRLRDLDNDGVDDPAGDMFPPDPFHARDMLREPVLDVVQLTESLRACGQGTMEEVVPTADGPFHTGISRTSCDWDGDGAPDIGGPDVQIRVHGVSMGGIMASMAAGVLDVDAAVATVPGGGLADVAGRTDIDAVSDGMVGRALTPLIIGRPGADGALVLSQLVITVDHTAELPFATLPAIPAGGRLVVQNLALGREEWGWIPADGAIRVPIAANAMDAAERAIATGIPRGGTVPGERYEIPENAGLGDPLHVEVYDADGALVASIDRFESELTHEGVTMSAGSPLVAASWGLGLRRGSAGLRRTIGVLALAIEPGDPIAYARRWADEPFDHPHKVLIHLTAGDTTVPIATGLALARAAGLVDYTAIDPRYGQTVDDWLIDRGVTRGMEEISGHIGADGGFVLFDPDDLDDGTDGTGAPSEEPMRLSRPVADGWLGLRVLYVSETGSHAYLLPDESLAFDPNLFGAQQMAHFLATAGTDLSDDPCLATRNCPFLPPLDGP